MIFSYLLNMQSHPSWVCGLKRFNKCTALGSAGSHPSWVCGLKQHIDNSLGVVLVSHPSWVCGLKLHRPGRPQAGNRVTPFVGVWIETPAVEEPLLNLRVTPFVGVWIETHYLTHN